MRRASYSRTAFLLHILYLSLLHLASSHAHPANPQTPALARLPPLSLPKPVPEPDDITIGQSIQRVIDTLKSDPSMQYRDSSILSCNLAVEFYEHGESHDLYSSSNVSYFRDIKCLFRYGGVPDDDQHSMFIIANKFPERWDQWALPIGIIAKMQPYDLPFAWSEVTMTVERADELLKADGHEPGEGWIGTYDFVNLQKVEEGVAWCFQNVIGEYPDTSAQHTYLVFVETGKVEQVLGCGTIIDGPYAVGTIPSLQNTTRSRVLID
ncbi:MAG: hypothetical protein Q9221_001046 [Calogaya cf. arnoldii]